MLCASMCSCLTLRVTHVVYSSTHVFPLMFRLPELPEANHNAYKIPSAGRNEVIEMVLMLVAWPVGGLIAGAILIPVAITLLMNPALTWAGALLLALAL